MPGYAAASNGAGGGVIWLRASVKGRMLQDVADEAVDQCAAMLGETLREFREAECRIVKRVNELLNHIHAGP